ncbi:prolyl 3-hydroxylase 1-like [Xenopus tropicalis]|uniref:procollagen-proline 3-dioxygenase n=1 Tax=Xenopus tropicalis TaxID=8364 RepID=A0A8J1JZE0_XENTR|nr:prolyl 3-hydroxylase 1-like [Xenopus tropicalis]
MNQNLAYYAAVLGEEEAKLINAKECLRLNLLFLFQNINSYIQRSLLEKELLYFAYDTFGIPFVDPDSWTPENVVLKRLREKQKMEKETAARITEEIGNLMKEIETRTIREGEMIRINIAQAVDEQSKCPWSPKMASVVPCNVTEAQGALSAVIITESRPVALCSVHRVVLLLPSLGRAVGLLMLMLKAAASAGDGYRGTTSPHTPNEKFHGVTVYKALKLGQEGKVPLSSALLYYNVTDKVRRVVESYFRLDSPLYFSYSHLVCRTAVEEKQEGRKDLSHPVHVDNCILNAEANMCIKEHPAYTFRDYSAILYLNGDFEGGNFVFTELDAKTITAEVRPQCGRMVGFSSGEENPHGVNAVTKGQRCAVALWFTLDPRHNERERVQADDLIKMLLSPEADLSQEEAQQTAEPLSLGEANLRQSGSESPSDTTDSVAAESTDSSIEHVRGPPVDSKPKTEL